MYYAGNGTINIIIASKEPYFINCHHLKDPEEGIAGRERDVWGGEASLHNKLNRPASELTKGSVSANKIYD